MAMWVRSEYAGELAVLSTWLCALLPWSVASLAGRELSAVYIRFLPFRFLYVFGATLPGERPFLFAWEVPGFVATPGETTAATAWVVGAVAFLLPLGLSVAYYARTDAVETRVSPRVTTGLLAAVVAVTAVAGPALGLPLAVAAALAAVAAVPLLAHAGLSGTPLGTAATPDGPVRTLGYLLVATGLLFLSVVGLHWQFTAGLTVPVGGLFQLLFGVVLLRTEQV